MHPLHVVDPLWSIALWGRAHLCINVARRNRDDSRVVQISTTLRRSAMLLTVVGRCTTFNGRQRVQSDCRLHISSTACAHAHYASGKKFNSIPWADDFESSWAFLRKYPCFHKSTAEIQDEATLGPEISYRRRRSMALTGLWSGCSVT